MCTPELSIVVYAWCAEPTLEQTLKSIQEQSFQEWECIVVDDGSTDRTAAIVKKVVEQDGRFSLIRQSHGGAAKARNRGFMESRPTTAYVSFIDAGDIWLPGAANELINILNENEEAVGAHGIADNFDRNAQHFGASPRESLQRPRLEYHNGIFRELLPSEPTSFRTLICEDFLSPSGVLVARRSAYERTGLYNPKLSGGNQQWNMTLRLCMLGPIRYLDRVVITGRHLEPSSMDTGAWGNSLRRMQLGSSWGLSDCSKHQAAMNESWRAMQCMRIKRNCRSALESCLKGEFAAFSSGVSSMLLHFIEYLAGHPLSG